MDGHIILGLQQHLKQLYLLGAGVPRRMNTEEYRVGDDLYPRAGELVYDPADIFFVSGYRA